MIKIIKRAATPMPPQRASTELPQTQSVTETVNDWITVSRKTRLENDESSRRTIAGWAAESNV